jgi:hypothetical protein
VEIDWTWQELEEKEDCEELDKVIIESKNNGHRISTPRRMHASR